MKGVITRKDLLRVARTFGWRKAFKLLISSKPTALVTLMS